MEFRLESSHRDLELALHSVVAALAAERGVKVKETRLKLNATSDRELDLRVECEVSAMIVSATLVVRGRAEVGDDLCVRISELELEGTGMVASVARAAIEPKMQEWRGRAFALGAVKLPGLATKAVRVTAGENVCLTVELAPVEALA